MHIIFNTHFSQILGGLYHVPQIPAGFQSFQRIPVDSGGIKNGREASQHCHSRGHIFRGNKAIPELRLECSPGITRTECDWNPYTGINKLPYMSVMASTIITFAYTAGL